MPEDHVAHEAIVLLHFKQAAQVPFRQLIFAQSNKHDDIEAGVPEPLIRIRAEGGCHVAVVVVQQP
jgi:hypothetical protein